MDVEVNVNNLDLRIMFDVNYNRKVKVELNIKIQIVVKYLNYKSLFSMFVCFLLRAVCFTIAHTSA
jgi:hypothetical protein